MSEFRQRHTPRYLEDHFVTRGRVASDIVVVAVAVAMMKKLMTEKCIESSTRE